MSSASGFLDSIALEGIVGMRHESHALAATLRSDFWKGTATATVVPARFERIFTRPP